MSEALHHEWTFRPFAGIIADVRSLAGNGLTAAEMVPAFRSAHPPGASPVVTQTLRYSPK